MFLIGKEESDKYVKDFIFALEEKWKMTKKRGCVNWEGIKSEVLKGYSEASKANTFLYVCVMALHWQQFMLTLQIRDGFDLSVDPDKYWTSEQIQTSAQRLWPPTCFGTYTQYYILCSSSCRTSSRSVHRMTGFGTKWVAFFQRRSWPVPRTSTARIQRKWHTGGVGGIQITPLVVY